MYDNPNDKRARRNYLLGEKTQELNRYFDLDYFSLNKRKTDEYVRLDNNRKIKKFETREFKRIEINRRFEAEEKKLAERYNEQLSDYILSLKIKELSMS